MHGAGLLEGKILTEKIASFMGAGHRRDESWRAHDPSGPWVCHADASRKADAEAQAEVSVAAGRKPRGAIRALKVVPL